MIAFAIRSLSGARSEYCNLVSLPNNLRMT